MGASRGEGHYRSETDIGNTTILFDQERILEIVRIENVEITREEAIFRNPLILSMKLDGFEGWFWMLLAAVKPAP